MDFAYTWDTTINGSINFSSTLAAANAIRLNAPNGGFDIDAGTAGVAVDTTGAISLDAVNGSNFSVTGAGQDLTLAATNGFLVLTCGTSGIQLNSNGVLTLNAANYIYFEPTDFYVFRTDAETLIGDENITLTASAIINVVYYATALTVNRTWQCPTASAINAALSGGFAGATFWFHVINEDASETIELTTNTGITLRGDMTVAAGTSGTFLFRHVSLAASSVMRIGS